MLVMILACSKEEIQNTDTQEIVDTAQEDTSIELEEVDTAQEEIECPSLDVTVSWNEESVELSFITFDEEGSYFFGMAQTGIDNPNVWTGEDCFLGYTVDDTTFSYCHPARNGISLQYGASFTDVVEGFSTHFASPQFEQQITYIIKESISGCCWIWGEDPSYYQELDCIPITDSE